MRARRIVIRAAVAVLAIACVSGASASVGDPPVGPDVDVALPTDDPSPASTPTAQAGPVPQPSPAARTPLPDTVSLVRPDLRIDGIDATAAAQLAALGDVDGVVAAATLPISVHTTDGMKQLEALIVDPVAFRPFTPDVTALEPAVWERLLDGEAVFTQAAAHTAGAILGEPATLSGPTASEAVRVGALAANGLPQLADLLITWEVGQRLGASSSDTAFVAVSDGASPHDVSEVVAGLTGATVEVLEEPVPQQTTVASIGATTLESFTYQSVGDGTIRIDGGWVSRNIARGSVPILGQVTCHRIMFPQLHGALAEIQAAGLAHLVSDYGGCYVPRHILWDPNRGISHHAWGLAVDFNVQANLYGAQPTMDVRIVEIFERWGFEWGGDWSTPDGMHFELDRIFS